MPVEDGVLTVKDTFVPNSKQLAFFRLANDKRYDEILFDGSIRAGKTQACVKQIVAWAWQYGGRYVVARKTYRELEDSTKAVFLRGEGAMPPGCPPQLVAQVSEQHQRVLLKNGAEIMFRSLESREDARVKLRNLSLNAIFIDQVEELDTDDDFHLYEELKGRLSDPRGPGKMILASNPGPEDHWVYRRFIDPESRLPWTSHVHVTLYDNRINLDERYFTDRERTQFSNPDYYRRFILGQWGAFGGKRFKAWSNERHLVEPFEIPPHWDVMESIDYGMSNPFAVLWIAIDPEERWWVINEHYMPETPLSKHARVIKEKRDQMVVQPSVTWLDPSAFNRMGQYESVAFELADCGIPCARAQNERLGGWARLDEMLIYEMPDGRPRLQVFNTCKNLIRELPSARFKDGTDDIEKMNDHALDALRYAIMSRPPAPLTPHLEEDADRHDVYARELVERMTVESREALFLGG